MNSSNKILDILEKNKGKRMSGETLAEELHISRAAVWKAIKQLREQGHIISAVKNGGYCLEAGSSVLSKASLNSRLDNDFYTLDIRDSVSSTNVLLKQLAEDGADEGYCLIANSQTSGKGRMGRQYFSPSDTGIYMSILFRPKMKVEDALLLTTCYAVVTAEAIEKATGLDTKIKWVNDIFVNDRKVCGILTEASVNIENGMLDYAVVGIGINVYNPDSSFPDELKNIAGALICEGSKKKDYKSEIISEILNGFNAYYPTLTDRDYYEDYRRRSFLLNKKVSFIQSGNKTTGIVRDIDKNFALVIEMPDGTSFSLSTGEVSVKFR